MSRRRSNGSRRKGSSRRRASTTFTVSGRVAREVLALMLVLAAIISTIALFAPEAGKIVGPWHRWLEYLLGWGIAFAPLLLAGFAFMLWLKTMPAERWMAATGAAVAALALLGMFHLLGGNGAEGVERGDGGGAVGLAVSATMTGAIGAPGAWIILGVLLVVGLLLYFNMTVGDLIAAWLRRRDEREELAAIEERRAATDQRGRSAPPGPPAAESKGLLDRVRSVLVGGGADEDAPLILRRSRPAETGAAVRARETGTSVAAPTAADPGAQLTVEGLETEETAHIAEVEHSEVIDAALKAVGRSWELPTCPSSTTPPPAALPSST